MNEKQQVEGESNFNSRVARIHALALETFGDDAEANRWLYKPLRQLQGRTPEQMLETEQGAHELEIILNKISHSIAA